MICKILFIIVLLFSFSTPPANAGIFKKAVKTVAVIKAAKTISKVKKIVVSKKKYPEAAKHIEDAQKAGSPKTLTIDRAGAAARRKEAMKGKPTQKGTDRDEYPMAMTKEGGKGSSVRNISPSDNRGAGACIGAQCRNLPNGSKINIKVAD